MKWGEKGGVKWKWGGKLIKKKKEEVTRNYVRGVDANLNLMENSENLAWKTTRKENYAEKVPGGEII